jgi:hypothetical protein
MKRLGSAAAVLVISAAATLLAATSAEAYPYGCSSGYLYNGSGAYGGEAYCSEGDGYYRVGIHCDRPYNPYDYNRYGLWTWPGMAYGSVAKCDAGHKADRIWIEYR